MKYSIKSELGWLHNGRSKYKEEYGNKRKRLIYWSDLENRDEQIKWNIIRLLGLFISIKLFAPNIKKVRIIKVEDSTPKGEKK